MGALTDLLSKGDLKFVIALSSWIVILALVIATATGYIVPTEDSIQEDIVRNTSAMFGVILGLAFGKWLWEPRDANT